ncbi:MAG: (4Fe-4S)-binding protein [Deltaproteobacteria bacterium]|nr:(4Fe-4S)-binding protein [Deltaproteobacteria bacterium]
MSQAGTRTVKTIRVDADKCNGCQACEVICSAFHARPKNSSNNPARARIRVVRDPIADIFLPVYAGGYAAAECAGRMRYAVDGKAYGECALCRASCPSRDIFKEPDSGLPLKCDMCESEPPLSEPMCVQWCLNGALSYEERPAQAGAEAGPSELDAGLQAMADRHGWESVRGAVARMSGRR